MPVRSFLPLAFIICCFVPAPASAADRPNVLFMAVDDLNDWISALGGHPQSVTPNIDRLVAKGTLFTHCYCAAPACNPSRAALMTGIRPATSGVYHNPNPWRKGLPDAVTIPQHFMAHGYRAMGSGKIFHGSFPDPPSWDEYWPSKEKQTPGDPMPEHRPINGIPKTAHFDWGPIDATDADMGDYKVADWVIGQLGQKQEKPFFLACGMFRPHLPWYVPRHYFERFPIDQVQLPQVLENDLADIPEAGVKIAKPQGDHAKVLAHKQWHLAVQGYLASIAFCDAQIGRVLDALEASDYANNTIIVFWTDHGWHLGEKEHWRKFALWEEATKTPMIIAAPGTTPGVRCDQPVNLLDIYPTLIDLCGLKARPELEGVSLKPLLKDPQAKWTRPSLTTFGRNNHALRSGHFRYIRYADGSEELYDHQKDPMEWTNLAGDSQYDSVKSELAEYFPQRNVPEIERKDESKKAKNAKKAKDKKK